MTLTRDSMIITVTLIAGVLGFLGGHFELMTKAFPGLGLAWQARIELISGLVAVAAGVLRMSPLALSQRNDMSTTDASQTLNPITNKPKE
jgi:hypothetical protein